MMFIVIHTMAAGGRRVKAVRYVATVLLPLRHLQPTKTRSPKPRLSQLLRGEPAHQPRRRSASRQRTRRHQWPTFSRGDCGYGSEQKLLEHGQRSLPCLFKLRHTAKVKELVALFYNWWNLYLRFYDEEHHREAIRTRPMLMSGVSRQIQSDGRRTVKVSVLHEKGGFIAEAVTRITNELHHIRAITERWSVDQHWTLQLTRLLRRWLGGKWLPGLPDDAGFLLSG